MKKPIIKILLIIFSYFYSVSLSQTKGNYEFLYQVNKNLPKYGFNIEKNNKEQDFKSYLIKIYQSDLNSLIQIISLDFIALPYDPYIDSLIDVNFDGYKDLFIVTGLGQNGKNQSNDIFLFNPEDKKFHHSDGFSSILNIETNDSLKQIYGSYFTGCLDCVDISTYIVKNNKPVLIEVDTQYLDSNKKMVRFIIKYKDGKPVSRTEVDPG